MQNPKSAYRNKPRGPKQTHIPEPNFQIRNSPLEISPFDHLNMSRASDFEFGSLKVWIQNSNEPPRSKLRGIRRMRWKEPKGVTPKCLNRGSSSGFAWIPAKHMRE